MASGRALAIRWGAYGDCLYCLPALEALKAEYPYLHLETGSRGVELFRHNPLFDKITAFDLSRYNADSHQEVARIRWESLEAAGWDKVVNFWRCLEVSCIAEEWQESFFYPRERRREIFGGKSFLDTHFERVGIPVPADVSCGTVWFDDGTADWMRSFHVKHKDDFVVAFSLCGSTAQKIPHGLQDIARRAACEFGAKIYLLGNKEAEQLAFTFGEGNVCNVVGKWNYMQSLALTKLADYVVGPETSLLVGAGVFGTPKSMICTSAGVEQATKYNRNDFSVQSSAACSPCHRAVYNYQGQASQRFCNTDDSAFGRIPVCNFGFDADAVFKGIEFAYKMRSMRRGVERHDGRSFGSLPEMRSLPVDDSVRDGEIR